MGLQRAQDGGDLSTGRAARRGRLRFPRAARTATSSMAGIPRYRPTELPALLSAGFRPFFLCGALWSAIAVPIWLAVYAGETEIPASLPPVVWHVHEMV